MTNKEKELISKIDTKKVKERWSELFFKSCTQELSRQEEIEKKKLEKIIVILRIN